MVEIKINVKASNDQKYEVSVEPSATVTQLKQILAEKCDTPVERQRLIYSGRVLKDSETVESYKIAEGHTLHLVRGAANPATTTSAAPSGGAPTATTPSVQPQVPLNPAAPNMFGGGNPLAALAGLGGFGGMGGMGNMGGMEGFGGMDPNMMNGLLQNPMFLQSMSAMMANPQMMDVMIAMNPQLASVITPEFRTMMQSPEFRQMMSDPATLQMMAQLGGMGGMGGLGGLGGMGGMSGNLLGTLGVPNAGTSPVSPNPATTVPNPTPTTPVNSFGVPGLGNSNANSAAAQMALLQQMFAAGGGGGGMGMFGAPNSAPGQPQQPPEERFATQIQQLNDMGFWDAQSNVRALTATNGNVNGAVEWLLSNPM